MIKHIHHINFLVRDLNKAVNHYQEILGLGEAIYDELPSRAVRTARFKLAETWLILVQPLDKSSAPALHMQKHGEGFFLMSLACDDLQQTLSNITANGGKTDSGEIRKGLDNWQVADLDQQQFFGVQLQITEETN